MRSSRGSEGLLALGASLVAAALLGGCAPADACAEMCTAALARFETCIEADGREWGESVGYADAADYTNGCETFTWELRELGQADTCATRLAVFRGDASEGEDADGDAACVEYYDAWGVE